MEEGDSGSERGSGGADVRETYEGHWETANPDSIPNAIVNTIATAEEVDPTELTEPLGDTIDVDALVRVLASGRENSTLEVRFAYAGWTVTARGDGTVVVRS